MLNSTDKKKISKILDEKIAGYKEDLLNKTKNNIDIKAKELTQKPPSGLIAATKELNTLAIKKQTLEKNTHIDFPGWEIKTSYGEDAYKTELEYKNEYVSSGRYNTKTITIYKHPELVKIQKEIEAKNKKIEDLGKTATIELYLETGRAPLEIIEKLKKDADKIINDN